MNCKRNKVYSYLNSFLSLSRLSKHTRNKVSYNVDDDALDYVLESDEEDLGQLEDNNDGDSSTDSKDNDDDNLVSIAEECSKSNIDNTPYKLTALNPIMSLCPRPL